MWADKSEGNLQYVVWRFWFRSGNHHPTPGERTRGPTVGKPPRSAPSNPNSGSLCPLTRRSFNNNSKNAFAKGFYEETVSFGPPKRNAQTHQESGLGRGEKTTTQVRSRVQFQFPTPQTKKPRGARRHTKPIACLHASTQMPGIARRLFQSDIKRPSVWLGCNTKE